MIKLPSLLGFQFACCVLIFALGADAALCAPDRAACGSRIFEGTARSLTYSFWSSFECVSRIDRQLLAKPATAMGVSAR